MPRVRHRTVRRAVPYAPTPRVPPERPPVAYDRAQAAAILAASLTPGTHLPPTGRCYDCDRRVSGERRYCGPCLNHHPHDRTTTP